MLPEIGASELLIIAVVALIVVGPKDLPLLLRKLGQFMAKLRGMAAEFRSSFDEMARQAELDELRREVAAMRSGQFGDAGDAGQVEISQTFDDIHRELSDVGVDLNQPGAFPYSAPEDASALEPPPKKPRTRRAATKPAVEVAEAPAPRAPRKRKPKTIVEPGS